MSTRRPTIIEVADRAKVAVSTVSRVLNGGYASAAAKTRVAKAVKELGYTPSTTARNLKMGLTGSIGVVVETSQGSWFLQLLGGIEQELAEHRSSLLLGSLALHGKYNLNVVMSWIKERRVDGLIFARPGKPERPLVTAAHRAGFPMVFVAADENFRQGPVFRTRNSDAGADIAEHLVKLGHRRIAFVGGPRASIDTMNRLEGLKAGLKAAGLQLLASNTVFAETYSHEGGIAYAEKWLKLSSKRAPTAVVLANDSLAMGFMRTVQQGGAQIPRDLSVVGFDGVPEGGLCWPGLTTAAQPTQALGRAACQTLLRLMQAPELAQNTAVELPMSLLIRESTGPVPTRSRR